MKTHLFLIVSFLFFQNIHAQDPLFVQSHSNAIYLNPALTGCFISPVISVSYRNQWPETFAASETFSTSYHQFVNALHGGVGFYYFHDDLAKSLLLTDQVNFSYAAHFELSDKLVIRVGATGGYVKREMDWERLDDGYYYSTHPEPASTKEYFDCGIGTVAYVKNIYAGFAIDHVNQPDISFYNDDHGKLYSKLVIHAGGYIPIGDSSKMISINPALIYQKQNERDQTIPSITIRMNYILFGAAFREDIPVLYLGFENKYLRVGYSYDWVHTNFGKYDSNEVSLAVKLYKVAPKKRKWTAINMEAF